MPPGGVRMEWCKGKGESEDEDEDKRSVSA